MTREEKIEKLRHLITCMKCEVSGKCCDDNCPTQYEAGNMGEIIENLEEIAKALEQEPCEDWYDVPSDKMTLGQARQAVRDLRKMWAEHLWQEPCEDAISRQAMLEWCGDINMDVYTNEVKDFVLSLPPVTPKQKTGRWIKYGVPRCGEQHYQCTSCGYYINFGQWGEVYTKQFKYCPNCGAKMIEPQESEVQE